MDQIIKICKKYQVKIISDEIHMDIQLRDRKHIPLLSYIHEYDGPATVIALNALNADCHT